MSKIHVFDGGDFYRLECWAGTRKDMAAVVAICDVTSGQTWEELTAEVAEHQAEHGCGDDRAVGGAEPGPLAPGQAWEALKEYLRQRIDQDAAVHRDFLTAGDMPTAAPYGGLVSANRATLAKMQELEAGHG